MLRPFGIRLAARQGTGKFDEAARAACRDDDLLYACVNALLEALAAIEVQIAALDKLVRARGRTSKPCWHLMSVPCIGPITALAFATAIEDPNRFHHSRDVGAYLGVQGTCYLFSGWDSEKFRANGKSRENFPGRSSRNK